MMMGGVSTHWGNRGADYTATNCSNIPTAYSSMYEKRDENCHQQQLDDEAHGDDDEGEKVEGLACFVPLPLTTVFFFCGRQVIRL